MKVLVAIASVLGALSGIVFGLAIRFGVVFLTVAAAIAAYKWLM